MLCCLSLQTFFPCGFSGSFHFFDAGTAGVDTFADDTAAVDVGAVHLFV